MTANFDCIIIGAGLAGLSAARKLNNSGLQTLIIEASDRVGGRVATDYVDGFTLDRGFQVINPGYPELRRLNALAGLDFHAVKSAFINAQRDQKFEITDLLNSRLANVPEKFAFAKFMLSRKIAGTLKNYSFSFSNLYDNLISPFFTGVFLCEPDELSAQINQQIIRTFIYSYLTRKLPGLPTGGVARLAMNLSQGGGPILLNERVTKISTNQVTTKNNRYRFRKLIIATDYQAARRLIPKLAPMQFNFSSTFYFSSPKLSSKKDLLVVNGDRGLVNSGVISNFNPNYAPADKSLISATFVSKSVNTRELKRQLEKIWQIQTNEIDFIKGYQIAQSLPKFTKTKLVNSNQISDQIYLAGDYLTSPSQQGALLSGRLAAEAVIRSVKVI